MNSRGEEIYNLCSQLFPICRSITGDGVRETLRILQSHQPKLNIFEIPTNTVCFDWKIPEEWNIHDAYILDPDGKKIVDFKKNNLQVVGYSVPIDTYISLEELKSHLYSIPEQPEAIPYVTSYYKRRWGFCLSHIQRKSLKPGKYYVKIDSTLKKGSLSYGEIIIPGSSNKEILLSTYICHPSMANNEISGPTVLTYISKWLLSLQNRYYTYRIIYIPETIGSIAYLSKNLEHLKKHVVAGYVLTCIGDNREYSYLETRYGNTLSDRIATHVCDNFLPTCKKYSFLERGSDERQFNSPGVDLPIASLMRSKYAEYPEYHTSFDNMDFISPEGLQGGFNFAQKCIQCLENNTIPEIQVYCEPQLGKRGLYPTLSTKESGLAIKNLMNLIAYCDGKNDLVSIANIIKMPMWDLFTYIDQLKELDLIIDRRDMH